MREIIFGERCFYVYPVWRICQNILPRNNRQISVLYAEFHTHPIDEFSGEDFGRERIDDHTSYSSFERTCSELSVVSRSDELLFQARMIGHLDMLVCEESGDILQEDIDDTRENCF